MPYRRPAPAETATTLLRRHGDFAVYRVMEIIHAGEAEGRSDTAWWHRVLDAIWWLTAGERRDGRAVH